MPQEQCKLRRRPVGAAADIANFSCKSPNSEIAHQTSHDTIQQQTLFLKDDKHIKPWDHLYLRSVGKRRVEQHTIAMTLGSTLNSIGDVMVKLVIRPVSQLSSRKCSAFSSTSRLFSSAHLFCSIERNLRMKQSLVRHMARNKQQTFLARGLLKILGTTSQNAML